MVPMTVTARLAAGIANAVPWGISLDGLLASQHRESIKAAAREEDADYPAYDPAVVPSDYDLPLARCTGAGGDQWHWSATFAWPDGEIEGPHVQYWSARPDQHALGQNAEHMPALVSERQGRYRARVMPLPLTVARALVWRAVGDPDAIATLVDGITSIGKKRASGNGHILRWDVTTEPGADPWAYGHLHPDGSLGRTIPPECLPDTRTRTGGFGQMGLRPPYMHPARRSQVYLPAR